jgi:hypothetical protein
MRRRIALIGDHAVERGHADIRGGFPDRDGETGRFELSECFTAGVVVDRG